MQKRISTVGSALQGYMGYPCSSFPLKTHLFEMLRNTSLSRQPRYHLRINSWSARAQSLESAVLSSNIPQLDLFPLHDCVKCWNYFQSFPFKKKPYTNLGFNFHKFSRGALPFFLVGYSISPNLPVGLSTFIPKSETLLRQEYVNSRLWVYAHIP